MNILGLFVRFPQPGQVKTRLAKEIGDEASAALYSAFLSDLTARLAQTGDARVFCTTPATPEAMNYFSKLGEVEGRGRALFEIWKQPDGVLGDRLAAFFHWAFERGGTRVIALGSDSPTLPVAVIRDAFEKLADNDVVLGPACDGGYYLVGLNPKTGAIRGNRKLKSDHSRSDTRITAIFDGIDWSTASVFEQTVSHIIEMDFSLHLLPFWYDVDTVEDLQVLRGHLTATEYLNPVHETKATAFELNRLFQPRK